MGNGIFTTEKEKELKSLQVEIDNRLSKDEINSFEKLWKETFGSSAVEIDKTQFRTWLKVSKLFPQITDASPIDHLFRAYDKDGSGLVSFREFIIFLSITSPTQKDRDLEKLIEVTFSLYDANGDGMLTEDELTNGMLDSFRLLGHNVEAKRFQNVVQSRVKKIVSVADINNDGVVSLGEIKDAINKDPELLKLF